MDILTIIILCIALVVGIKLLRGVISFVFNLAVIAGIIWAIWYFFLS